MKRKIKSYLAFTSLFYRIIVFVLLPLVAVGLYCLVGSINAGVGLIFVMELLIVAEIFFDTWLFGGIQSKESEKLDYLKTSSQGMEVIKNALQMDLIRRLLTAAGIFAVCYLVGDFHGSSVQEVAILLYPIPVSYTISVLGVFLARYEGGMWINMAIGYVATIFGLLCWFVPGLKKYAICYVLGFSVLAVLISILAVTVAKNKVEGSYYDK